MPGTLSTEKHDAILQAAVAIFQKAGYTNACMDDIAQRACVSKRTIYKHFAGKKALFTEISDSLCRRIVEVTDMPFDPERSPQEQLLELARRQLQLMASEDFITMARVTFPERARHPELTNRSFDRIRCGETGLARWFAAAQTAGVLRVPDPAVTGRQFSALLLEFAFWPCLVIGDPTPDADQREAIARSSVELFLNGCRPS